MLPTRKNSHRPRVHCVQDALLDHLHVYVVRGLDARMA
jgi:hypothetical protein